jgi:hypothetical protein
MESLGQDASLFVDALVTREGSARLTEIESDLGGHGIWGQRFFDALAALDDNGLIYLTDQIDGYLVSWDRERIESAFRDGRLEGYLPPRLPPHHRGRLSPLAERLH